jgi:hypothetical protein
MMKMSRRSLLLRPVLLAIALLLLHVSAGVAQVGKLLPVDEAVRDPDFFTFRAQLQAAVARHDTAAVLDIVDPKITNSFGGDGGLQEFREQWKLSGADSPLWAELGLLLALGGTFNGRDNFAAPYVWNRWPDELDAFEHVAAVGSNVRVRSKPSLDSQILAKLSFEIVPVSSGRNQELTPKQRDQWWAVRLRDGREGYVSSQYVRSAVGYRAIFSRQSGSWRLTTLVAGD